MMSGLSLYTNLMFSIGGTLVLIVYYGITNLMEKLRKIVPEEDIKLMIREQIAPGSVKTDMIYNELVHIREQVDKLIEGMLDDRRDSKTH